MNIEEFLRKILKLKKLILLGNDYLKIHKCIKKILTFSFGILLQQPNLQNKVILVIVNIFNCYYHCIIIIFIDMCIYTKFPLNVRVFII